MYKTIAKIFSHMNKGVSLSDRRLLTGNERHNIRFFIKNSSAYKQYYADKNLSKLDKEVLDSIYRDIDANHLIPLLNDFKSIKSNALIFNNLKLEIQKKISRYISLLDSDRTDIKLSNISNTTRENMYKLLKDLSCFIQKDNKGEKEQTKECTSIKDIDVPKSSNNTGEIEEPSSPIEDTIPISSNASSLQTKTEQEQSIVPFDTKQYTHSHQLPIDRSLPIKLQEAINYVNSLDIYIEFKAVLIENLNKSKSIKDINETLTILRGTDPSISDSNSEYSYLNPFLDKLLGYWPENVSTTKIYRDKKYKYIEDYTEQESSNRRYLEYLITTLIDSSFDKLAELKLIGEAGETVYIEKKVEATRWFEYDFGNNHIVIQPWETKTHFRNTNILGRLKPFKERVFRSLEEYTAEANGFYNIDSLKFFSDIVEQLASEFNTCNIDVELMGFLIKDVIADSIKKITVMSSYKDKSGEIIDHSKVNSTYNLINLIRSLEHLTPVYHVKHMTTNQEYVKDIEEINNRYKNRQLTRLDVCMHEEEYIERSIKYLEKYIEEELAVMCEFRRSGILANIMNKDHNNTATPLEKEFLYTYCGGSGSVKCLLVSLTNEIYHYLIGNRLGKKINLYSKSAGKLTKYLSTSGNKETLKDQAKGKELAKSSSKRLDRSSSNSSASVRR